MDAPAFADETKRSMKQIGKVRVWDSMEKFDRGVFAYRLKELMATKRYTIEELSEVLEATEKATKSALSGVASLKPASLYNLREKISVNIDWLLTGKGEMFLGEEAKIQPEASNQPAVATDPIAQRLDTATRILKDSGAPPEVVQQAVMKILGS